MNNHLLKKTHAILIAAICMLGMLFCVTSTTYAQTPPVPSSYDVSNQLGGLLVSFPPDQQNITQTSAVIEANVHAVIDLPFVELAYIWNKTGDPSANMELQLVKIPGPKGLKAGEDTSGTLVFSGLTPGTAYSFVIRNKITNTISEPVRFITPTAEGQKSYVSYLNGAYDYSPSGGYDAPAGNGIIDDTVSDTGIVPKCGRTPGKGDNINDLQFQPCGYREFLQLIANIIKYALIIIGPIIAIMVIASGFIIMIYGKIPDPTSEQKAILKGAKQRLVKIGIGILIILSAWILIATITRELGVKEGYTLLDLVTGN